MEGAGEGTGKERREARSRGEEAREERRTREGGRESDV